MVSRILQFPLIIFDINDDDLNKMSNTKYQKTGFTVLDDRIDEYVKCYQNENDCNTWKLHFAGYPGIYKETSQISNTEYCEDFGGIIFYARGSYDEQQGIILDFSAIKENAAIIKPDAEFSEEKMDFGGISGGPVFIAETKANPFGISLLGIVYKGSGEKDGIISTYEFVYAKPISLLQDVLLSR